MSEYVYAGLTSQTIDIFLADSSSSTGAGLTSLVYNTSGLTCYYRKGATGSATAITLATQTVGGAWSSGGFVEVDSTNMPGIYRLDVPNAAVDSEGFVTIYLHGASNLLPTALRLDCRPVPADIKQIKTDATSVTDLKSLVDTDFTARTLPSGEYFNWSENADFTTLQVYISGRTIPSGSYVQTNDVTISGIKDQTDKLTFDASNNVSANIKKINDQTVIGDGSSNNKWRA